MAWQGALQGEKRRQGAAVLESLAASLRAGPSDTVGLSPEAQLVARSTLPNGAAGLALFFAHLSRTVDVRPNRALAARFLDDAMQGVAVHPMRPALHGGFSGVGWVAAQLASLGFESEAADPLEALDAALLKLLPARGGSIDYDLISGLAGFGTFALERWPRASARAILEQVIYALAARVEVRPEGLVIRTRPEHLPPRDREHFPTGYYVLGVAHGLAGVLPLLAAAIRLDVAREDAQRLLAGFTRFLLAKDRADEPFPYWVGEGVPHAPARSAWCHGDPGIAVALLAAAKATGDPDLAHAGRRIARRAALRPVEQAGVDEAGLCHGAAGLAHLFGRAFQYSEDEALLAAARHWFDRALALLEAARSPTNVQGSAPAIGPGFLLGRAGLGLALLSAVQPLEPTWDRVLGLSLPELGGN